MRTIYNAPIDPRETRLRLNSFDLAVIIHNILEASNDVAIGFLDSERTVKGITKDFSRVVKVKQSLLESGLYFCNLMSENGKFWHPTGKSVDEFIADIIRVSGKPYRFDKDYHLFFDRT